ncbi:MAG: cytochrome c3 family protein [Deltaproteobacteria bacterium]|nr:cytochrome c3 family protein [Deltaproteobacteria bacterium]
MSSKRNCAICHVMWLDDFRTDKETLIKWQPGNVLMKDTQGVVSSEEMCYSCHDGYVMDSRAVTWKYKGHRTFVKPSDKVTIPADLPLSNKDEIYCGTCHSAHGGGANTDASISGALSFLRKNNIDSQMCEMCHTKQASFRQFNGHPVKTTSFDIPKTFFEAGSKRSKSGDKVICQTCHEVHGAKGDKLTVIENRDSGLCMLCHPKQKSLLQTKHDFRFSLPEEKNIRGQKPSSSGPCGACHLPHNGDGILLWAREIDPAAPPSQICLGCHGEDSVLKIRHVGNHSHPVDVALSGAESATAMLPLFLGNGNSGPSGKVQCFTCHNVHRWDPENALNIGGKDVKGDASTSFLRISSFGSSALCTDCHKDKRQLLTSDHNLEITAPDEKNLQELTARASGPCGACHVVHNASGKRLWAKPLTGKKDFISELCAGCHNKTGAAKEKLVGNNSHPIDVPLLETKMGIILQGVSSELPLYSKDGEKIDKGNVSCNTCHEPHHWTPSTSGPLEDYKGQNMEGNGANSFLRKANFPSPELCKLCHLAKGRIQGTKHDFREWASDQKSQGAKPPGLCQASHLVHNAPNPLKLWARPYGPISENGTPMNRLCTSCHSKGNMAQKKIPPVARHPTGKLITNVVELNKNGRNYTLLFGPDGKEKNVGNLSCPSCHNAHQWGIPAENGATGNKLQGTSTKSFRFLRTMSYNAVCRDCHGPEGFYRYLYFHDPVKRLTWIKP